MLFIAALLVSATAAPLAVPRAAWCVEPRGAVQGEARATLADGSVLSVCAAESASSVAPFRGAAAVWLVQGAGADAVESVEGVDVFAAGSAVLLVADDAEAMRAATNALPRAASVRPIDAAPGATLRVPRQPLPAVARDDGVEAAVAAVDEGSLFGIVDQLSEGFFTRHSNSYEGVLAGEYIFDFFADLDLSPQRQPFLANYSSNVYAEIVGTTRPEDILIVSAHYDSRGLLRNDVSARAPGANDDASGTAAVMEAARAIALSGVRTEATIRFVAFSGEEQGLEGSKFHAAAAANNGDRLFAVLQSDMIGHMVPGTSPQFDLVTTDTDPELNQFIADAAALYVDGVGVGSTTACCSDDISFRGPYPSISTAVFVSNTTDPVTGRDNGYANDPTYHTPNDIHARDDYSFAQLKAVTQSIVAASVALAVPV